MSTIEMTVMTIINCENEYFKPVVTTTYFSIVIDKRLNKPRMHDVLQIIPDIVQSELSLQFSSFSI